MRRDYFLKLEPMMAASPKKPASPYQKAERHLSRRDSILREVIRRVGPCTLTPKPDHFAVLVHTIIAQQISSKAAISIGAKLETAVGGNGFRPELFSSLDDVAIRACGLSGGKMKALRDLCAKVLDETVPLGRLHELDDEDLRERLLRVHGIGPWSADMFLMFSLGRPDILPVGDLGLRAGVQDVYELPALPTPKELTVLAEPWRPYRSVATWYFWRSRGPVPQSK